MRKITERHGTNSCLHLQCCVPFVPCRYILLFTEYKRAHMTFKYFYTKYSGCIEKSQSTDAT